ncbi:MAG: polysaccharide deacetylase family protein [Clostridia bacterium]|nr:polysaccharide deacetylase family protein [Clostridia bacterium]
MDVKVVTKSEIIKYVAIILAFVLLITTVVFGVKNNKANEENEQLSSQLAENESILEEKLSENKALEEERNNLDELYKSSIELNDTHESIVDDLNKQLEELNKQLSAKKNKGEESTTKKKENEAVLPEPIPAKGKTVYLTFDDGPSIYTDEVLDILDKYGVKATFFVVNGKNNHIMKEIVDRGHTIGLHCYRHVYSEIYASDEAYFEDLQKIHDVVKKETGVDADIIRFPGGGSNTISKKYSKGIMTRLTASVVEKGYTYFDWNCYNGDADGANTVEKQLNNIAQFPRGAKNIVVLMHDNKEATIKSLPKIIEYFQSCEMTFGVLTKDTEYTNHPVYN